MGHHCCCEAAHPENSKMQYVLPVGALLMLLGGMVMKARGMEFFMQGYGALLWYVVAYLLVGLPVLKEAWESVCRRDFFNEFTLMVIATLGAFYIGEYPEGVAVMLFYTVGEMFQERAVGRARRSVAALLDVRPEVARVVGTDTVEIRTPEKVKTGEIIEVKAGERVPLDGVLLDRYAVFDTAALTGESVPRPVSGGEDVYAGMIATGQVVRIQVSRLYEQSALTRILQMVEEASGRKAPAELFMRRFARVYTPLVTGLAALVVLIPWVVSWANPGFHFIFHDWLYRALVFLVISCPCALVVSIPLGYFGGIGAASRQGILFKGGNYLDAITKINTVVFDKTGTLTKGVFEVQQVCPEGKTGARELVGLMAALEQQSNHPVASAIVKYARRNGDMPAEVSEVKELAGYGLAAELGGQSLLVGNARLLEKYGVAYPEEVGHIAGTVVCCALAGRYQGYLVLADALKEDSCQAVDGLRALGIKKICILSGDRQEIVDHLAQTLGGIEAAGDLLPDGKARELERLKQIPGANVAFVGDGINDAPVLAMSEVGIAMGGLGSDVAIETADVVIQNDQPSKIATAIRIGRQTRRIIWQNISLAFGVKLLILLLGAGGMATLWEAVFADVGVALIAIGNAIRIQQKRF